MKRQDRAVYNRSEICNCIARCTCCRLGFSDSQGVYIVPLSFGFESVGETDYFYFHSAQVGRKIDCIRENARVGFELDEGFALQSAESACGYTARYASIIGTGEIELLKTPEEKRHGLLKIMEHYTHRTDWDFSEKMLTATAVLRLRVDKLSCKANRG